MPNHSPTSAQHPQRSGEDETHAGPTILVTGGTDGIGKATATRLARRGATVAIVGSTAAKGERAAQEIADETTSGDVTFLQADLSRMRGVRRLAGDVKERYDRLDALVHSAGVIFSERVVTPEGLEASFAINYLSRFLLTRLLMGPLRASAPARIVNVAYAAGNPADALDFDNLQSETSFSGMQALNQAQVANDLFGLELAERLQGTDVGVAVVNPGLVDTDIRKKRAPWFMPLIDYVLWFQRRTADEVAKTPARLAVDVAPEAMNGGFFGPEGEEISVPDDLQDPALRERLWHASDELSGLSEKRTARSRTASPSRLDALD
jgi:NAD(P)-dependent dehydrogenase (short-subunit alcohol dehydrogenase family)